MSSSHLPPEVILLPKKFATSTDLDNIASRYKSLRLQSLLSDPYSFSSTYERESQFTLDTWRSKVQNPVAKTFVTVVDGDDQISSKATYSNTNENGHSADKEFQRLLQTEWVGSVTLLGPEIWCKEEEEDDDATIRPWDLFTKAKAAPQMAIQRYGYLNCHLVYLIAGMFVASHVRRKGHGHQLVEIAVDHARKEAKGLMSSNASIVLQTSQGAASAQLFYEQVGFEVMMVSLPYTAMVRDIDLQMTE
ncbi:hypothetical protein PENANT_c009G00086 [Penicillium antarcticum]|uniref:N-acetyltransferase domain-containing protein n=1 Tax=Penicillium antarcticum TaxID=416450 RepID=A0A1V6Q9B7_9EURO|nr:uncharacterized protein N7508_006310 [Penicillium antarcticum]KAJ5301447.1 hypothetical protein N7508_006310 [Penicillium antarcticum]OQD85804.1 hypothetical protein PENANT_c009G00086 [Penicillium antarcticum]